MGDTIVIETPVATVLEVSGKQGPQGPAGAGIATLTTKGDTLYRGDTTGERLPIGATGQVLKVSAQGLPSWANESGAVTSVNGATGAVTVAAAQHAAEHAAGGSDALFDQDLNTTDTVEFYGFRVGNVQFDASNADDPQSVFFPNSSGTIAFIDQIPTQFAASAITSGTLDIARIPTGTGSTQVALGNHTHAASDITSGTVAVARLPIFTYGAGGQGLVPQSFGGQAGQFLKGDGNWTSVTASDVGLGNVSNTAQVTSVNGTAPIVSSGGTTPAISINAATTSAAGSMSAADKTKLDAISGTNTGDQTITLTGDVTGSGTGSFAATIANNAVTNAKLAQVATSTIKGRATAATGNVEDLTATQVRTILNVADGATANSSDATLLNRANHTGTQAAGTITGLAAIATSGSASDLGSGTVPIGRLGASGTPSGSTYLAGDNTWKAAGGVTTGSVDNAILRADGTGGSTSQSSDLVIDDATTTTQNNVAIRNNHSLTDSALVLTPKGTGAFIVGPKPDGTSTGGNARGSGAICIQTSRTAATQVASTTDSIAIGNRSTSSSSLGESVAIGPATTASGSYSTCVGGRATATATYCTSLGHDADATTTGATALGNRTSATSTDAIAIGTSASCSGAYAVSIGRDQSVTASNAFQFGSFLGANSAVNSCGFNIVPTVRAQFATLPFSAVYWSGQTTNNTATILNLDGTATNRFTIAASTALAVDILLVARRATTQDKWLVARRFLGIRRDATNTALIGNVQTLGTDQSAGSPTWTFALTADTTNNALQLEVAGATGETVEWRATAFYRVA